MVPAATDVVLTPNDDILPGTLCDVHGPAGDGRRTGSDGRRCYLLHGNCRFELPRLRSQTGQVRLSYDRSFPLWEAFSEVVRPLLQLATIKRGAVTVQGTAVQVGEGGLLVCGWSETGKTETALALAESGARFISDKWTIIDSRASIHAFPVPVGNVTGCLTTCPVSGRVSGRHNGPACVSRAPRAVRCRCSADRRQLRLALSSNHSWIERSPSRAGSRSGKPK